jgi:hypothetical protein
MILFVFEGRRREPQLYKTMEYLFFNRKDSIICSYCDNIYALYNRMNESAFTEDIVTVLQEELDKTPQNPLNDITDREIISEVFLFFDYDCHNQNACTPVTLSETNDHLQQMLSFFNDETDNGKLYINYPMVESLQYTKQLPDKDFNSYTVPVSDCHDFKKLTNDFTFYKNLDFISFRMNKANELRTPDPDRTVAIKNNWNMITQQHVGKANFICTGIETTAVKKDAIQQQVLFEMQLTKYVSSKNEVAILNAFPLFLYEYLK